MPSICDTTCPSIADADVAEESVAAKPIDSLVNCRSSTARKSSMPAKSLGAGIDAGPWRQWRRVSPPRDLIQFRKEFGTANVTSLVERVSRFTVLLKNAARKSRPVMEGIITGLSPLPFHARRSITFDRGSSSRPGPICKQASVSPSGSAIRRPRGRREPTKTPTVAPADIFPAKRTRRR
jgi:hypothetical protein